MYRNFFFTYTWNNLADVLYYVCKKNSVIRWPVVYGVIKTGSGSTPLPVSLCLWRLYYRWFLLSSHRLMHSTITPATIETNSVTKISVMAPPPSCAKFRNGSEYSISQVERNYQIIHNILVFWKCNSLTILLLCANLHSSQSDNTHTGRA